MAYDKNNIFAKILRGEIAAEKIFENEFALSIKDAFPAAPIHILVLPKGEFVNFHDFMENATPEFIAGFYKAVRQTVDAIGLNDEKGYRISMNTGKAAGQSVFHYHVHITSGFGNVGHV
jgi:histidine triad (HIT) family protein